MIILTFVLSLSSIKGASYSQTSLIPDFAFPAKVENRSDSLMKVYLRNHDEVMAIRELMNNCLASNMLLDSESPKRNLNLIDSVNASLSPEYRRIGSLLKAEILLQTYLSKSYVFDSRKLPDDSPYPEDPMEWSGVMFKKEILSLVENATDSLNSTDVSINTISPLLIIPEDAEKTDLSLYDFILFKSANILKRISGDNVETVIPFFSNENDGSHSVSATCKKKTRSLLQSLIQCNESKKNYIAAALAICEYSELLGPEVSEKYLECNLKEYLKNEGGGILLNRIWMKRDFSNGMTESDLYNKINVWISLYPKGVMTETLRYFLSSMSQKKIELNLPRLALPGEKISGEVMMSNIEEGYVLIYKVNASQTDNHDGLILKNFIAEKNAEQVIPVKCKGKVPFSLNKKFEIEGLSEGLYVAIPSDTKKLSKGWNKTSDGSYYSTFRVTDISILSSFDGAEKDSGRIYVVKASNQQPVKGAQVRLYQGNNKKAKYILTTGADGSVKVPTGYYRVEAEYGRSLARWEAGFSYYPNNGKAYPHASILTDLSVYRPGDTVGFVVIGWMQQQEYKSLVKDSVINITLRDANYNEVETISLTLDKYGRAEGRFEIPDGKLLGTYRLFASYEHDKNVTAGSANIEVAEYKLPEFKVTIDKTGVADNVSEEILKFNGLAETYAGMPVSDAPVNITVNYLPWYGLRGPYVAAAYHTVTTTLSDGTFNLSLPTEGLKGTVFENGRYSIIARVTSSTGDSQESAPLYFYLGKDISLRPSISDRIEVASDTLKLNVRAYNIIGTPECVDVEYRIINLNDSSAVLNGVFKSPVLEIPSSTLPSGRYKFEFYISGTECKETTEAVVYRPDDIEVPYPTALWLPKTTYTYNDTDSYVEIKFGSFWHGSHVLCLVSDKNGIIDNSWIEVDSIIKSLKIDIPRGKREFYVSMTGMHDFRVETGRITLQSEKMLEKMEIETISFRPDISAGDKEDWKFKLKVGDRPSGSAPAMAVMSDKALNAIKDFRWFINFPGHNMYCKTHLGGMYYGTVSTTRYLSSVKGNYQSWSFMPSWETYGYPLFSSGLRFENVRLYKSSARYAAKADNAIAETASAMGNMAMSRTTDEAEDAVVTEEEASGETGNVETGSEELRPVEMPLAFFLPGLITNDEGELALEFTVPDFNTTWQLQVAGYNDELLNASIVMDAIASKPVMAKSNLPQFLRTGDKASISAILYNNSAEEIKIGGRIEIGDAISGRIIHIERFSDENIMPSMGRTITCSFEVPDYTSLIYVKTYAVSGNHTDGEQGFINVRPSSTPVVESTAFYLNSNEENYSVMLPKFNNGDNLTLKYCDNPLWDVLLSLPVIVESNGRSVLSIAKTIFATSIGKNIIESNPGIGESLEKVLNSEDLTLTMSNLQKDESLKIAALEMTPWVNDANSETMRIRSLSYLLDSQKVENQLAEEIRKLKGLQMSDGGWSWFEGMSASPYITSEVIGLLGWLNSRGLLNDELKTMARNATRYYEKWIVKQKNEKHPVGINTVIQYLYNRSSFNYAYVKGMNSIENEALEEAVKEWRHWDLSRKAMAAIVLWKSGKYKEEAKTIVASLQEFTGRQRSFADLSMMLEAFSLISPKSIGEDNARQLLLMKKETEQWGSIAENAGVIHSLLSSSPKQITSRRMPQIFIGKEKLNLSSTQELTGNFTINLNPKDVAGRMMTIKREPGQPAWGGVICQRILPIKDVKPAKVKDLAIEKSIYIEDGSGKTINPSELKEGDKVIVSLKISCGKDMDYVALTDERAACLQPVQKISGIRFIDGLISYMEVRSDKTSFFIERLPAGKHVISYECTVDRDGEYSLGIATVQCLYSPIEVSHSGGDMIDVN